MRNNSGFSLVEAMLAMLIMLISILGVYGVVAISMSTNVQNEARDQAVRIAEEVTNRIRGLPWIDIAPETPRWYDPGHNGWNTVVMFQRLGFNPVDIDGNGSDDYAGLTRTVRKRAIPYGVEVNVVFHPPGAASPELKDVQVRVNWVYGEKNLSHTVGTIVRRPRD